MSDPVNCTSFELSTYLRALEEGYLATSYLDTTPSVPLKLNPIASKSYTQGSKTVSFRGFPSLQMSKSSTGDHGGDSLTACVEGSHAKILASPILCQKQMESQEKEADYGPKCEGSLARWNQSMSLWKTRQHSLFGGLTEFLGTWPRWGTMRTGEFWELATPELLIKEREYGLWPTPMKTDGFAVGWCETDVCRRERGETRPSGAHIGSGLKSFRKTGQYLSNGYPNPLLTEWLMGWPSMWTDLQPLATAKFQQWLDSHGTL